MTIREADKPFEDYFGNEELYEDLRRELYEEIWKRDREESSMKRDLQEEIYEESP